MTEPLPIREGVVPELDLEREMLDYCQARSPTHYCAVCAARWIKWPDGNWSVLTDCGPCCDNAAMDQAPIIEFQPDGSVSGDDHQRVRSAWDDARWQGLVERYRGIGCAICEAPFEQHSREWNCPHRVAPRFKFPRQASPEGQSS